MLPFVKLLFKWCAFYLMLALAGVNTLEFVAGKHVSSSSSVDIVKSGQEKETIIGLKQKKYKEVKKVTDKFEHLIQPQIGHLKKESDAKRPKVENKENNKKGKKEQKKGQKKEEKKGHKGKESNRKENQEHHKKGGRHEKKSEHHKKDENHKSGKKEKQEKKSNGHKERHQ